MAILKFKPAYKNYMWGGQRLIEEYDFDCYDKICAEAWMLSAHPDGESHIINGKFAGKTLSEYLQLNGMEILGTNCRRFKEFPILIKLIDARESLSVQVHPNDEYALINEGQLGKTEMWYIIDAEEDSRINCGFIQDNTPKEIREHLIFDPSLSDYLNFIKVKKGDVFFIPPGTVHAVGSGILLAEIQQSSNVSYRIYDYRRGRPLHIEKALDVMNLDSYDGRCHSSHPHLVYCDYFVVDKLYLDGKFLSEARGIVDEKSFLSILILDGEGKISCGRERIFYRKGDSILVTANSGDWKICGSCNALLTTIP